MDKTDEQLIVDYQQGDQQAVAALFQRYKMHVINFSLRFIGNRADAEDVTSEAFICVIHHKYEQRPGATFKTWLFTLVRNASITKLRKKKNMFSLWLNNEEGEAKAIDVPDENYLTDTDIQKEESRVIVRKAIQSLPIGQKDALILRQYHNLSYLEIAQILGCTLDQVKVTIFRAREQLRKILLSQRNEGSI